MAALSPSTTQFPHTYCALTEHLQGRSVIHFPQQK
jgi:hypothetical protein